MRNSTNFIIPLVVFPFDVMVSVAQTNEEFRKSLIKRIPPDCLEDLEEDPVILNMPISVSGRTINFTKGHQTVIRLKRYPRTSNDYGVLAHEIFHAVSFILFRMDIKFKIHKTDEVYAYLIGYLTTEIYKRI